MTHRYRILIGACGWIHPAWQDEFYPDDLPEDWQLGYYSNEFPVVLLPADQWEAVRHEIGDWLEDCHDELVIVSEIPADFSRLPSRQAQDGINAFLAELAVLNAHCQAVIFPVHEMNNELEKMIAGLKSPVPVCIEASNALSLDDKKSIQKICESNDWSLVWHGETDVVGLDWGEFAICRINGKGLDMRGLRRIVETMLEKTRPEQISILLFDGGPPDLATIRNANVILDLL